MLSPDYLKSCANAVLGIFDGLQTSIAQDIAASLVKHGSMISTAQWQAERLQECGKIMDDVVKDVAAYSKLSEVEVQKAFEQAAVRSLKNDSEPLVSAGIVKKSQIVLSSEMQQLVEATVKKTNGYLGNLTMTTGITARGMYLEQTNLAYMRVVSGSVSYQKAIADAVKEAAKEGSWVVYGYNGNGSYNRDRLDVAVRRSVMTGVNQTCGQITEMWAEDMDVEYYEVDAHIGARPSHQDWEGQVYKINGSDENYQNFYEATGYGSGDGLCGYNCRHSFYPFWPGISKRNYTKADLKAMQDVTYEYEGKTMTDYQCSQVQRAYERNIRECKRVLASYDAAMTASDDSSLVKELRERFENESLTLKNMEKEMKQFCTATNRRVDSSRTQVVAYKDNSGQVVNFGHSTSMKAVWASKRAV